MTGPPLSSGVRRLAGASVVYGLGSLVSRGLALLLLPLYTRHLSPSDYGIVAVTMSISSVLGVILPLGLQGAVARFYFLTSNDLERRATNGTIWIASIVAAGCLTLLLDRTGALLFARVIPALPFDPYVRLGLWGAFLSVLGLVPLTLLQVQERPRAYVLLSLFSSLATAAAIVLLVVWRNEGAYGYLRGVVLGGLFAAVPYLFVARHSVKPVVHPALLLAALGYCLPLVPHALASWALELSDRAILTRFVSMDEVGVYAIGYQLGAIVGIAISAFNSAWIPILFRGLAREEAEADRELSRLATYYVAVILLGCLAWGILCQHVIALALASTYAQAYRVTRLIVVAYALNALYILPVNLLFWTRTTWQIPLISAAAGAVNITLNLLWVPRFGVMAAAWNTIVGYFIMLIVAWLFARKQRPFPFEYARLARVVAAAAGLFALGVLAGRGQNTTALVLQVAIVCSYPLVLLALRIVEPGDLRAAAQRLVFRLRA
jgi:O-antigen/teichoic acid export membrane protein